MCQTKHRRVENHRHGYDREEDMDREHRQVYQPHGTGREDGLLEAPAGLPDAIESSRLQVGVPDGLVKQAIRF